MSGYKAGKDVRRLEDQVAILQQQMRRVVMSTQELQAQAVANREKIVLLQTSVDAMQTKVGDVVATMQQIITELQALVDAGTSTPAEMQVVVDELKAQAVLLDEVTKDVASTITQPEPPVIEP